MSTREHFLIKDFEQLLKSGSLSHAYLFWGESRLATDAIGENILNLLENNSGGILLDGLKLQANGEGNIGIDEARSAISFLWQRPVSSARRTVFISGADKLTAQAQNALLKTLEDPPEHGLLILGAPNAESLLPPLTSRLQKIYISSIIEAPDEAARARVAKFIRASSKERKEIIVEMLELESDDVVRAFIKEILIECRKDPVKNFQLMKNTVHRWAKISQFNTNKKLQLETLLF